mmetsp:Transcript_24745/g.36958  ORF Transcript_24745/g.36958 Transcript_24745/m.36958 type:complete len:381 (-) Transcript_24745:1256-2398(-)
MQTIKSSRLEPFTIIMIDNSQNVYIPFHLKCGVTTRCSLEVFDECPEILDIIEDDIHNCLRTLPSSVHELVRRTNIWINVTYSYGRLDNPKELKHTNTHHYEKWLVCVRDIPEKVLGIEIYNCFEYIQNRNHWNGCGLLLHEFCHLIHQLVLPEGLNNQGVKDMYELAMESRLYDKVLRRDWAYLSCDKDTAYATINHKEFFAELSVAYLSCGYGYLDTIENSGSNTIDTLSPPFQAPEILHRRPCGDLTETFIINEKHQRQNILSRDFHKKLRNVLSAFTEKGSHCNKFYPFTKKQLKSYDHATYVHLTELWSIVESWTDPLGIKPCWWKLLICLKGKNDEDEKEQSLLHNDHTSIASQNNLFLRTEGTASLVPDSVDL